MAIKRVVQKWLVDTDTVPVSVRRGTADPDDIFIEQDMVQKDSGPDQVVIEKWAVKFLIRALQEAIGEEDD